jgi:hypothetical protein
VLDGSINNMYNLLDDPGETRDLFYVYPDIAARLKQKLAEWEAQFPNA